MEKLKVMTIFGTRPEAIKMCPVILEMQKFPEYIQPIVAVTAQHREMLDQVMNLFRIKPDYDLNNIVDCFVTFPSPFIPFYETNNIETSLFKARSKTANSRE